MDLTPLCESLHTRKDALIRHLKKNYKVNIHYITKPNPENKYGGNNKVDYFLTEKTYKLLKNTFNLRNNYVFDVSDDVKQVNLIAMCIENQTIGFIQNCYESLLNVKRQYMLDNIYRLDLYFIDYKLVIECDENNHKDRDPVAELERHNYILSKGNTIIRFDPNKEDFDLSSVIKEINKFLFNIILNK